MKKEFFKFVFLGAGSSVFTMRLVGDILKEDTIKKGISHLWIWMKSCLERRKKL